MQVVLAIQTSVLHPTAGLQLLYQYSDIMFNVAFLVEFLLKVVALGWWNTGAAAYMRNFWNVSDFVLLVGSIACTWGRG